MLKAEWVVRMTKTEAISEVAIMDVRKRGFTMIELMIVVGIFAIVAAMAIPTYMSHLRNYRVRNDANNIVGLTTIARMRAGANFSRAAVSCDAPAGAPSTCRIYTLQNASSGTPCTLSTWTLEPQQYTFSATVIFAIPAAATLGVMGQSTTAPAQVYSGITPTPPPYTIYFNSRGWPVDCNGNAITNYALYLQDQPGVFSAAVGIDPSGRGQVYLLNGGSYWVVKD
jgi:prepilin-type N-terminal cleavage/methylation domain-containing protein